jgi:hypothetical protein
MFLFALVLRIGIMRARKLFEAHEAFTLAPVTMVGIQLMLCWLLYFYTASALRESVLKLNGKLLSHTFWRPALPFAIGKVPRQAALFISSAPCR